MQKALVIGSEGNIGKPLCTFLKQKGYDVLASDIRSSSRDGFIMADITNPADLIPAFDWRPDIVFLLGAMVSRVTCEQASSLAVNTNLLGVQNVLDLTKKHNAKLVYFSTSEVYGPELDVMTEAVVPKPNNRYGLTKLLSESLVKYEVENYGLRAVILRPFMIYSEDEDFGDHRSAMIRFAYNLANGKSISVHEGSVRGWMHISDALRSIEASCKVENFEIINIGSPELHEVIYLAELIRKELNAPADLIKISKLPGRMTLNKNPDLTKQREILGIIPEISLETGIKKVCEKVLQRIAVEKIHPGDFPFKSSVKLHAEG